MSEKLARGKTVADGCSFIMFIQAAVPILDGDSFETYFGSELYKFMDEKKHPLVLKYLVKLLPDIWSDVRCAYTLPVVEKIAKIIK